MLRGLITARFALAVSSTCACQMELAAPAPAIEQALTGASPRVSLTVEPADDFVYITVNGVRRQVVAGSRLEQLDVTDWFFAGQNTIRIQAFNTTGPATYAVSFAIDGHTLIEERCSAAPCDGTGQRNGLVFDRTYVISVPRLSAASELTITGTAGARIYLDDAYTGHSVPSTFTLPVGEYVVGLGVGEGSPGAYEGTFLEQPVQLGPSPSTLQLAAASPMAATNVTRLAILPIRTTYHGTSGPLDTGVLAQADIDVLRGQAEATSSAWLQPFSYGLTRWEVTVLPVVEDAALYRDAAADSSPDTQRLLREAGLTDLEQRYDSIVYLYSELTPDGEPVEHQPCCFWGNGQMVAFQNGQLRGASASEPNVFLLHEMLHDYESFQATRLGFYNGLSGTHGAEVHGYPRDADGEMDFIEFYRAFMRGQVAEVAAMREDVAWAGARPEDPDAWIGVFETMRHGVVW